MVFLYKIGIGTNPVVYKQSNLTNRVQYSFQLLRVNSKLLIFKMSSLLTKKVFYIVKDGKRYRFTETIELLETTIIETIDLTKDEEESNDTPKRPDTPNRPDTPRDSPFPPSYLPESP